MIGFQLNLNQLKANFFDRDKVLDAVNRATAKNLSKAGSFVRRTAKGLIRKVGKKGEPSKPGHPPKSRTGLLKEFIFFAFEQRRESVVIGPAKLNQVFVKDGRPMAGTVPEVLEFGGQIGVIEIFKFNRWRRADLRSKRRNAGFPTRIRTVTIKPRPYMAPALAKEAPKFPAIWADSVKGSGA